LHYRAISFTECCPLHKTNILSVLSYPWDAAKYDGRSIYEHEDLARQCLVSGNKGEKNIVEMEKKLQKMKIQYDNLSAELERCKKNAGGSA